MKNVWIKFLASNVEITESMLISTLDAIITQSDSNLCLIIDGDSLNVRFAKND